MTIRREFNDPYEVLKARLIAHIHTKVIGYYVDAAITLANDRLDMFESLHRNNANAGYAGGQQFERFVEDTANMGVYPKGAE